jgi:hypothetical protein
MTGEIIVGHQLRPADIDLTGGFAPFTFSQGPRPLCLAFAASSAHKLVRATDQDFSPEALWQTCWVSGATSENGTTIDAVGAAIGSPGQPLLRQWPYNPGLGHLTEEAPLQAKTDSWHVTLAPGGQGHIEAALASGRPVLIAIALSDEFSLVRGAAIVEVPETLPYPQGYHAILIVGASWDEGVGRIYRVLNSWGTDWADGGYTWLPALYVDRYTVGAATFS